MMLHYKFPRYLEDGAFSLTSALPTIYSSVASPLGVVQHLCRQLGLPLSCVRPVPVNTHFGMLVLLPINKNNVKMHVVHAYNGYGFQNITLSECKKILNVIYY